MRVRVCSFAFVILMVAGIAVPNVTGQAAPPQPPTTPAAPDAAAAPQPPEQPAPPRAPARPRRGNEARIAIPNAAHAQPVNVRVDATVTESRGSEVVAKKVLSVTVLDGENGSVRSKLSVPFRPKGTNSFTYDEAPLNMDARVNLLDDNRVRVGLVLDYKGARLDSAADEQQAGNAAPAVTVLPDTLDRGIRQAVTVVLENGKPMVVAQSADAIGDRRVALEVKATVLK